MSSRAEMLTSVTVLTGDVTDEDGLASHSCLPLQAEYSAG